MQGILFYITSAMTSDTPPCWKRFYVLLNVSMKIDTLLEHVASFPTGRKLKYTFLYHPSYD